MDSQNTADMYINSDNDELNAMLSSINENDNILDMRMLDNSLNRMISKEDADDQSAKFLANAFYLTPEQQVNNILQLNSALNPKRRNTFTHNSTNQPNNISKRRTKSSNKHKIQDRFNTFSSQIKLNYDAILSERNERILSLERELESQRQESKMLKKMLLEGVGSVRTTLSVLRG